MNATDNPFEVYARDYDDWYDEHPDFFSSELAAIRAVLPPRRGPWVEVGIGTGRFAAALGLDVGIEPARAMAELARARGARVLPGRAERLPLSASSVNALFFITTLCFVRDVDASLAEARRVLSADGAIVVAFVPRDSMLGRAAASSDDPFFRLATLRTPAEVFRSLQRGGFLVDRVVQTLLRPETSRRRASETPIPGFDRGSFVACRALLAAPYGPSRSSPPGILDRMDPPYVGSTP